MSRECYLKNDVRQSRGFMESASEEMEEIGDMEGALLADAAIIAIDVVKRHVARVTEDPGMADEDLPGVHSW